MLVFGIEKDEDIIYLVKIKKSFNKIKIIKLFSFSQNKQFPKKLQKYNIASFIPADQLLVKSQSFSIANIGLLKKALPLQSQMLTPTNPDNYISTLLIEKRAPQDFCVRFFIATKKNLLSLIQNYQKSAIDPDHITSELHCLCRFAHYISCQTTTSFIVHIKKNHTICLFMKNFIPISFHVINKGVQHFYEALSSDTLHFQNSQEIQKHLEKLHCCHLSSENYPELYKELTIWQNQIHQTFFSFMQKEKIGTLPLLITGYTGFTQGLSQFINDTNFAQNIISLPYEKIGKYALCIGGALDMLAQDKNTVQFRKKDFVTKKEKKKKRLALASYFLLSFFLSITLYTAGKYYLENRKEKLQQNLISLYQSDPSLNTSTLSISKDRHHLKNTLENTEKKIQKETHCFTTIPNILKVADIIAWIQQEKLFIESESKITQLTYELISYPRRDNPHKNYTVKISLEFLCPDPIKARQLHNKLYQQTSWIDTSQKIEWEACAKNLYRCRFIVKNLSPQKMYEKIF